MQEASTPYRYDSEQQVRIAQDTKIHNDNHSGSRYKENCEELYCEELRFEELNCDETHIRKFHEEMQKNAASERPHHAVDK